MGWAFSMAVPAAAKIAASTDASRSSTLISRRGEADRLAALRRLLTAMLISIAGTSARLST